MWVARDLDGKLHLFTKTLPYRYNSYWEDEIDFESNKVRINDSLFRELTWDDEPMEVKLVEVNNQSTFLDIGDMIEMESMGIGYMTEDGGFEYF